MHDILYILYILFDEKFDLEFSQIKVFDIWSKHLRYENSSFELPLKWIIFMTQTHVLLWFKLNSPKYDIIMI